MKQVIGSLCILVSILTSSWSASAINCHEAFRESPESLVWTLQANMVGPNGKLREMEIFKQALLRDPSTTNPIGQLSLVKDFSKIFKTSFEKLETFEETLAFFEFLSQFSKSEKGKDLLQLKTSLDQIDRLHKSWTQIAFSSHFLKLRDSITESQVQRLMDAMLDNPILHWKTENSDLTLINSFWYVVWNARISLIPREAFNEIWLLHKGSAQAMAIADPRMRQAFIDNLIPQHPDLINAVVSAPASLRTEFSNRFIKDFYLDFKNPRALTFLAKLNYSHLRATLRRLKEANTRGKIGESELIEIVDRMWLENGAMEASQLGGVMPRGGYSFRQVLESARLIQAEIRALPFSLSGKPKVLVFGSFANGMASITRNQNRTTDFLSDIDLTFVNTKPFEVNGIYDGSTGTKWIVKGDSNHSHYNFLLKAENSIAAQMNINGYKEGSILSPKAEFSAFDVFAMTVLNNGTYFLNSSPIALEVTGSKFVVHISAVKAGDSEPKTFSFEIK